MAGRRQVRLAALAVWIHSASSVWIVPAGADIGSRVPGRERLPTAILSESTHPSMAEQTHEASTTFNEGTQDERAAKAAWMRNNAKISHLEAARTSAKAKLAEKLSNASPSEANEEATVSLGQVEWQRQTSLVHHGMRFAGDLTVAQYDDSHKAAAKAPKRDRAQRRAAKQLQKEERELRRRRQAAADEIMRRRKKEIHDEEVDTKIAAAEANALSLAEQQAADSEVVDRAAVAEAAKETALAVLNEEARRELRREAAAAALEAAKALKAAATDMLFTGASAAAKAAQHVTAAESATKKDHAWQRRGVRARLKTKANTLASHASNWADRKREVHRELCEATERRAAVERKVERLSFFPEELALLGLTEDNVPSLDEKALRKAFRARSRKLHPDVIRQTSPDPESLMNADEEIRKLNKAYEVVRKLILV